MINHFTSYLDDHPEAKRPKRDCSYQTEWKSSGTSASRRGENFTHCDFELKLLYMYVSSYQSQLEQHTLCALVACKLNNDSKCFELATPTALFRLQQWSITANCSKFNNSYNNNDSVYS